MNKPEVASNGAVVTKLAREHGTPLAPERLLELLSLDVELNAQGLEVWLDRDRP